MTKCVSAVLYYAGTVLLPRSPTATRARLRKYFRFWCTAAFANTHRSLDTPALAFLVSLSGDAEALFCCVLRMLGI